MHSVPETVARTVKSAIISKLRAVLPRVTRMIDCNAAVSSTDERLGSHHESQLTKRNTRRGNFVVARRVCL